MKCCRMDERPPAEAPEIAPPSSSVRNGSKPCPTASSIQGSAPTRKAPIVMTSLDFVCHSLRSTKKPVGIVKTMVRPNAQNPSPASSPHRANPFSWRHTLSASNISKFPMSSASPYPPSETVV